jgi:hypothetical protein
MLLQDGIELRNCVDHSSQRYMACLPCTANPYVQFPCLLYYPHVSRWIVDGIPLVHAVFYNLDIIFICFCISLSLGFQNSSSCMIVSGKFILQRS